MWCRRHRCLSPSKKLETELGCELFDRCGNKLKLNQNGRLLKKALDTALSEIDQAVAALTAADSRPQGEIRLLVRSERRNILHYIYKFKQKYPGIVFHISHDFNTEDTDPWDFIIDELSPRYPDFVSVPLIREPIRLAASADNPLSKGPLLLSALKNEPFITMCTGSSLHRITVDACRQAGFTPNITIESDDPFYIKTCIDMNFGVAFFPEFSWKGQLGKNTRILDVLDFALSRITCVYRNQSRHLSPAAEAFFRGITEEFQAR